MDFTEDAVLKRTSLNNHLFYIGDKVERIERDNECLLEENLELKFIAKNRAKEINKLKESFTIFLNKLDNGNKIDLEFERRKIDFVLENTKYLSEIDPCLDSE